MSEGFGHLHVASSFSMRYGASIPAALVERAAEQGQPVLALTDRDGLYGAVRFVEACRTAGIQPVLGVDLAVRDLVGDDRAHRTQPSPAAGARAATARRRSPAKGGVLVEDDPRVTVLARGRGAGLAPGVGWGRLCRLVSATHLSGERGAPLATHAGIARSVRAADPAGTATPLTPSGAVTGFVPGRGGEPADAPDEAALTVLLGPWSDVGRALLQRRDSLARQLLDRWRQVLPADGLVIEVVHHGGPPGSPASLSHAARLWGLALEAGVPAVITAAARHARPEDAVTVDVLDAARRMVPLDERHLERVTRAGHLASTSAIRRAAQEVADAVGTVRGRSARAADLLARTELLARQCIQDGRRDLGIGAVHLPEPSVLGLAGQDPQRVLAERCQGAVATRYAGASERELGRVRQRLADELDVVAQLGYPTYFLTVTQVCDLIRDMGVRVAARGSGAGSLINYLLGISGVEPLQHDLLMERFCSPLRAALPDIDVDVESARRTEVYERILERFGGERVTCVSMMDTYRVRHAVRDVGAALGMAPAEVDAIAKAFPHIRARDARSAIAELPELRARALDAPSLQLLFELVERLDGLPRHIALHPCGVVLSNGRLLDRTPVEASWLGFPMSQLDKDDVETMGLLKLDVLGIRMQSAMTHAVAEVERVDGQRIDLDDRSQVPLDDERAFELVRSTRTLGCFQIESPGQRELVGKFGPETFEDLIIDISLFRPGPVKSDMITPFLRSRQGWQAPSYLHPSLEPALRSTHGVVVFHEQVLHIVAETTGVTLAQADEVRRALGSPQGQAEVEQWWRPAAQARGYTAGEVERIWSVLAAFASFGFCKAHAAAFALPTYQSAWLKAHHPAAFLAGVLTHDPGMYPKRLILADARQHGIQVLGLDVNASGRDYLVERVDEGGLDGPQGISEGEDNRGAAVSWADVPVGAGALPPAEPDADRADLARSFDDSGRGYGIRIALADVKGINDAEVERIVAGRPYASLADFWQRARVSRPVVERLVLGGGFDALYGLRGGARRGRVTRRDLLLHITELDRWTRSFTPAGRPSRRTRARTVIPSTDPAGPAPLDPARMAAVQAQGPRGISRPAPEPAQLTLDLGDAPELTSGSGLPELTADERVRAELEVLGLDVSAHILARYAPMLRALEVTRSGDLMRQRSRSELWVAGVKVATQTPPVRSGRRVVFLTLDDSTGPVDATFFEDVQGPYAATVFHSWMLLVRGVLRRTGPRGVSLRATGAWELASLWESWLAGGVDAVRAELAAADQRVRALADAAAGYTEQATEGAAQSRSSRPVMAGVGDPSSGERRVLVHASGFRQSPYADVRPAGDDVRGAPRKLWHSSPGSAGG